jgi:hypothetical protein
MQDQDISEEENKKIEIAALSLKTAMKGAGLFFLILLFSKQIHI